MSNEDKLKVIDEIMAQYYEFGNSHEDAPGILMAIAAVVAIKTDE